MSDVRAQFNYNIPKLYNPNTLDSAGKTCHQLIRDNKTDRQMVRIVICTLTDKDLINCTSYSANSATGFHCSLFGYLAS